MFEEENNDVRIYVVKTTVNQEKSVAKSMALVAKKEHLDIHSVLAPEELRGYVFVETPHPDLIDTLIQAIPHAKSMLKKPATIGEIEHFLKTKTHLFGNYRRLDYRNHIRPVQGRKSQSETYRFRPA